MFTCPSNQKRKQQAYKHGELEFHTPAYGLVKKKTASDDYFFNAPYPPPPTADSVVKHSV